MKLTDEQIKRIILDYAETQNLSETARRNGVSDTTVKRHLVNNPDVLKIVEDKKDQNTQTVLGHMETQKDKVIKTLDVMLESLNDPDKLKGATLQQVATSMGILIDKYTNKAVVAPSEIKVTLIRRGDKQ